MCTSAAMAAAAIEQPDFARMYGNKRLSDVTLVIFEEPEPDEQDLGSKRSAPALSEELPGHGVVLTVMSGYCRAALENWASNSSEGKYRLELSVPAGQLELGKLLVKGMYYPSLELTVLTQQQLLQVLQLADRYEVPKILAAICSALESIPPAELHWDTAMAIYSLPPGCAEGEACSGLCKAAAAKVQQELGDLELVWDDQEDKLKQQQLLGLPHQALKQLLESPKTAVHSENTVCCTIQAWHDHQVQLQQRPSLQKMKQLLELIRMRHCSQLYVLTVFSERKFVQKCFSQQDLRLAALVTGSHWATLQDAEHVVLKRYPAWTDAARPASKCQQELIDWRVPLSQVQALVQKSLNDVKSPAKLTGPVHVWQGRMLQLMLSCGMQDAAAGAAAAERQLRATLHMPGLAYGAVCSLQAKVTALAYGNAGSLVSFKSRGPDVFPFTGPTRPGYGWDNLIGLGRIDSWGAALVGLRNKRLVHGPLRAAGGGSGEEFLHIRWQITQLQ